MPLTEQEMKEIDAIAEQNGLTKIAPAQATPESDVIPIISVFVILLTIYLFILYKKGVFSFKKLKDKFRSDNKTTKKDLSSLFIVLAIFGLVILSWFLHPIIGIVSTIVTYALISNKETLAVVSGLALVVILVIGFNILMWNVHPVLGIISLFITFAFIK